jgi:cyclopropane fatty-acyl-phospholipid synthase-like methyltransferase
MSESLEREIFWAVHNDLPREGPGDDESTLRAFSMLAGLPPAPKILDIGCGTGPQTLALAHGTDARITAVDTHQPFLDELARKIAEAGLAERVQARNMSMFELAFPEPFDVLWSEGAIYAMGFEEGLRAWRPLLKPGGYVAVTEISWLRDDVPNEVQSYWNKEYPGMKPVAANLARLRRAGYREIGHFTLPESAWWEPYYTPISARIAQLREKYQSRHKAQSLLDEHFREVTMYRKYSAWYGYDFYVMQAA